MDERGDIMTSKAARKVIRAARWIVVASPIGYVAVSKRAALESLRSRADTDLVRVLTRQARGTVWVMDC